MSQKSQSDGGQKHFAVGRGLLAAAETLNFGMNEQRPNRQIGGMASGVGVGKGLEGQDSSQIIRHGSSSNLGSTMKLFASLGLSPSDLDALAKIPEEDISVETLPQILMQLKNRKGDAGERRVASSMSSDTAYRGGRDSWDDVQMGRMGGPSLGQGSARAQPSADFGYSSLQDVSSSRGYSLNYSSSGGGGSRERPYSELSHHDSYSGLGLGLPSSDPIFMQRRMGSPSNGKVQDFLGVMPPMFPHVCSLCDFDIHSTMEWTQHINGLRHAENRRLLLDMYPEWDPGMVSGRGGDLLDAPNLGAGLLGPAPMSQAAGGMSSSWGGSGGPGLSGTNQPGQIKLRSRVVVVKYDRKPLSNNTLFAFAKPFGCLMEHLVLKNKAFLEMNSHEEALDMVNYYDQHPASLYGKPLTFYLSKRLEFIEKEERQSDRPMDRPIREVKGFGSQVVFFSNLPRENEKKKELLTIAERFGTVEKHLFLTDQAFVQLGSPKDAEMLVKYYSMNPLTIKGRLIRLNICTKYKTLNVNRRQGGSGGDARNQRSSGANTTTTTTTSSCSSGTKTTSSSKSSLSKASSGSRLKEENKVKPSEKPAAEEEEEASRVMKGENGGEEGKRRDEQATDGDAEGEEPERTESVMETVGESEDVQREEEEVADGVDVSDEAPGPVGGAGGEVQQGAESEGQAEASTEEHKNKDEANAELGESSEAVEGELPADMFDENFLENMEDFVTLDELAEDEDEAHTELDSIDNTRKGGMRVVNIVGFRRGYNFLNELLALAKPFGKVLKHLVLDLRPEAYLQFETEEEARAMAKFYNSNVTASVCGRPVRVNHSLTYPTIQCGSSRVVYIGQIPSSKYADDTILKLAEPFGNIKKYFLNRIKRECFIEMEKAEDAEKMAEEYKVNPPKFSGKRLTVYVSRKYRQLKHGHQCPSRAKREISSTPTKSSKHPEEPPAKKSREDMSLEEKSEEEKLEEKSEEEKLEEKSKEEKLEEKREEEEEMQSSDVRMEAKQEEETSAESISDQNQNLQEEQEAEVDPSTNQSGQAEVPPPCAEPKVSIASLPLPPYNPSSPIGVEHVKMGYYCRVCFLFYSNEDTAKKTHCSSQMHYDKLQTYLEREKAKAEKKKGETTVV